MLRRREPLRYRGVTGLLDVSPHECIEQGQHFLPVGRLLTLRKPLSSLCLRQPGHVVDEEAAPDLGHVPLMTIERPRGDTGNDGESALLANRAHGAGALRVLSVAARLEIT